MATPRRRHLPADPAEHALVRQGAARRRSRDRRHLQLPCAPARRILEIVSARGSCPIAGRTLSLPRSAQRSGAAAISSPTRTTTGSWTDRTPSGTSAAAPPGGLFWPRCAFRAPTAARSIADSRNDRLILAGRRGVERVIGELCRGPRTVHVQGPARRPDGARRAPHRGGHREQSHRRARHGRHLVLHLPFLRGGGRRLAVVGSSQRQPRRRRRLLVSDTGNDRVVMLERRSGRIAEIETPLPAGRRRHVPEGAAGLSVRVRPLLHPGLGQSPGPHRRCAAPRRVVLAGHAGREPADAGPPTAALDDRGISAAAAGDGQRQRPRTRPQAASLVDLALAHRLGREVRPRP